MTIRFRCKCGRQFEVADSAAGRKARCTDCGLTFLVPSPHAQPAPLGGPRPAAPDNSPLAQAARAAQAAAAPPPAPHAAGPHAPAPHPAAAQAAAPRPHAPAPHPAPRPAAPPAGHRPASPPRAPAAPRPAAPQATHALRQDDDVPMARLAPAPVHHAPRKPNLAAVQAVMGISLVAALVVIVDSVTMMLGAIQAQAQGMELAYGGVALFAGIGMIVALAGGAGSRVCIGIMLGGAARNLLVNAPALLFLAFTKNEVVTSQGKDAVMFCGVAGVFSLLAGIVYIMAILLAKSVRKYIGGHYVAVIGGGVVGLLLGPAIVSTALPAPELVFARQITALRVQASTSTGPGGASVVLTPKQQTESREAMMEQMKDIHRAMSRYVYEEDRRRLPAFLGLLVGDDCPGKLFISPTRGPGATAHRDASGNITNSDVIYLFKDGRETTQFESAPNRAELIVAYSGPGCGLGDGALVMRLPGIQVAPVEWLDKATLEKQLAATNKWLKDNPATKNIMPEKLPGFDE